MLRRTGRTLAAASNVGGAISTPRASARDTNDEDAYLPWTARPWLLTYTRHHHNWKFLDIVCLHLATMKPHWPHAEALTPPELDVLADLEEPVMALRRQARRQRPARRHREDAEGANAVAVAATSASEGATPALQATADAVSVAEGETITDSSAVSAAVDGASKKVKAQAKKKSRRRAKSSSALQVFHV